MVKPERCLRSKKEYKRNPSAALRKLGRHNCSVEDLDSVPGGSVVAVIGPNEVQSPINQRAAVVLERWPKIAVPTRT